MSFYTAARISADKYTFERVDNGVYAVDTEQGPIIIQKVHPSSGPMHWVATNGDNNIEYRDCTRYAALHGALIKLHII